MTINPTGMDVFAQPERPGLVFDLDNDVYHSGVNSLSSSAAKVLLGKRPPTSQDALEFGSLVHTALLEPGKLVVPNFLVLDPNVIGVKQDGTPAASPKSTAAWKNRVKEAESEGYTVVSPDEEAGARYGIDKALAMADAVRSHKRAAELLAACPHREVSAYAEYQPGALVRGRFDLLGDNTIADFKTCLDASPERFERIAYDYGYYLQAAVYQFLAEANGIVNDGLHFILCEKDLTPGGNYRVSVLQLDDIYTIKGRKDFEEALRRWLALGKRVDLPGYSDREVIVGCPDYLIDDEMELI